MTWYQIKLCRKHAKGKENCAFDTDYKSLPYCANLDCRSDATTWVWIEVKD